jgi:hypothetical protein
MTQPRPALKKRVPDSTLPPDDPNVARVNVFRLAGYGGILVFFLFFAKLTHFRYRWALPPTSEGYIPYAARVALFLMLAVLAGRWVIATGHEFELWKNWIDNPPPKRDAYWAIAGLSFTLGLCLALAYDILWITSILTGYFLLNYWTQWLSNDHFKSALVRTRKGLRDVTRRGVLNVMEHYWLGQPQLARITTLMFFASVAFSFALAGALGTAPHKRGFHLAATILLILTILFGEMVIGWWRHERDQDIEKAVEGKLAVTFASPKRRLATKDDEADLKGFRTNAYYGIFGVWLGVASLAIAIDVLNNLKPGMLTFPSSWDPQAWIFVATVILFVTFLALSFCWILATGHELALWIEWLDNPVDKQEVRLAIIGLSLVLGVSLAFAIACNIVFISGFITIYLLVNYWTQWLSNDQFEQALEQTRESSLNRTDAKVLSVMEEYWVKRPQLARITTLMFVACMAYSLAFAGFFQEEPLRHRLYLASYCLLFLDIFIGEVVIFRWRFKRDRNITQAKQGGE